MGLVQPPLLRVGLPRLARGKGTGSHGLRAGGSGDVDDPDMGYDGRETSHGLRAGGSGDALAAAHNLRSLVARHRGKLSRPLSTATETRGARRRCPASRRKPAPGKACKLRRRRRGDALPARAPRLAP